MAFLSSLLNPEPTVDDSLLSLTQGDDDHSRANPGPYDASYRAAPDQNAREAVGALNTSSATNASPSASWTGHSAVHHSPTAAQPDTRNTSFTQDNRRPSFTQGDNGASFTRRLSAYSDNNAPVELPQPPQVARKMSSPTLDQYHVSSRSPEQHRRPSYVPTANDALTLAPIQSVPASSAPPSSSHALVGQDDSVMVKDDSETPHSHIAKIDVTNNIQFIADHRQPDYVRDEPTTSQIRQPSPTDLESTSQPQSLQSPPPLEITNPDNDTSVVTANPDPPFINLKQEHSAHAHSPLRESSVPVPSTEMPAPTTNLNVPKKPPPKSAGKKGTASSVKKEPPTKKRKTDSLAAAAKRSGTPSSTPKPKSAAKRLASTSATPVNSSRTASSPPRSLASPEPDHDADTLHSDDEEEEEEQGTPDPDAELYCLCRRPDTGTFMIGCDGGCDDWFHGKCVNIAERDKGLIDRYVCPRCSEKGLGPTTWKRMCRRVACRNPARTPSSKYCSDACGVLFFKELLATRTRVVGPDDQGARGGVLSVGEVRFLVDSVSSVEEFKRLGEPPATLYPSQKDESGEESSLTKAERERLTEIPRLKDNARNRHILLKDRIRFIMVVQQRATALAEARGLKPKDFCGFDPRIIWTDEEFANWRLIPEAAELLQSGVVNRATTQGSRIDTDGDTVMANGDEGEALDLCTKKRCARHNDWAKLAIDDTRFEMSENGEVMRGLDREEKEIVQRAGLRARVLKARGVEWEVEYHTHEDKEDKDDVSLAGATSTEPNERQEHEAEPKEERDHTVASSKEVQQLPVDTTDTVEVAT